MDLAEAAHKARMSIGLGDEQFDVDDLGRMDDRPRQAAAQSPGGVDRWEAANVSQRALGDVMLERGDGVRPGASLVDRGGDAGMNPSIVAADSPAGARGALPLYRQPARGAAWSACRRVARR